MVGGKPFLYFGGTAYLGLQTDEAFQEILIKNIKKFGTNYGASRKANVRIPIYERAENYLANLVGSENCNAGPAATSSANGTAAQAGQAEITTRPLR